MAKKKPVRNKILKAKAAFYARPLYARPKDMAALKERQTLRNEHIAGQAAMHRKLERERISTMLNENVAPQLRATLIKNRALLK
jgi:hypothetical protein